MDFTVRIEGDKVVAVSPEGKTAEMPLEEMLAQLALPSADTGSAALPPGISYVRSRGRCTVWVHETPPQVWNLKWVDPKSKVRSLGATYGDVVIALPYIVVFALFRPGAPDGQLTLSDSNECFFRNTPLESYDEDEVLVPALLNCSLYASPHDKEKIGVPGRSVVWICTQLLNRTAFMLEPNLGRRMYRGFEELMRNLMATGFNYSSDDHEYASGFQESRRVDRRVSSIKAWEKATKKDPNFPLTVPWLPTGYTVREIVERMFKHHGAANRGARRANDIARIVFNHHARSSGDRKKPCNLKKPA
ncbi:MAG: hypothetical protein ACYS0G_11760 [Planctomycetota bacterium]|jgi:hypothetical protein